jgi:DMSO/TMAO reductase YedYZ heme-binding membrane subunit
MSKAPWHVRKMRGLTYCFLSVAWIGIAVSAALDSPDPRHAWIAARQLYGLWALGLLVTSMVAGPLSSVLPWLPFRGHLVMSRRAIGVSSFGMAVSHAGCYLGPMIHSGNWRDLYAGNLWMCGLLIGLAILVALAVLACTSRRKVVRSLSPGRWKRLHRLVYVLLPAALLHATFTGTDFGVNKGPDVIGDADAGCLVGMVSFSLVWLVLFGLRKHHLRWTPVILQRSPSRGASGPFPG